jgi:hypothetical protein
MSIRKEIRNRYLNLKTFVTRSVFNRFHECGRELLLAQQNLRKITENVAISF